MCRTSLLIALMTVSLAVFAQDEQTTAVPWEESFYELMSMSEDEMSEEQWEDMYEQLSDLASNPININAADENSLSALPFLTALQIEDISYYIYRYKGMKSLGELLLIPSLDHPRRELLKQFVYLGEMETENKRKRFPPLSKILSYAKYEVLAQGRIPTYERKGDKEAYLGYPYKHSISWQMTSGQQLKAGIVGAQDAGEPFGTRGNKLGYDHYSYYLLLNDISPVVKTVALGCYKVQMGLGLVINTSFSLGKQQLLTTLNRTTDRITANTSRSSANYLQGAAVTLQPLKYLNVSGFASIVPRDGTPSGDGISSLTTTGYHRTVTEIERKHNVTETLLGANATWHPGALRLGVTAVYTHLSRFLQPDTKQLYRRYMPSGTDFSNIGVNYGYTHHRFSLNGETAIDGNGNLATINIVGVRLSHELDLTAVQRFYSMRYESLKARSFSSGGRMQDESGVYLSANYHPTRTFSVQLYGDYAYYAWPRYLTSRETSSAEAYVQATWQPHKWKVLTRYSYRWRQRDGEEKKSLLPVVQNRAKLQVGYTDDMWSESTQVNLATNDFKEHSLGYSITQTISFKLQPWLRLNAQVSRFKTDDYDSRIYIYEANMYRNMSSQSFYGDGWRCSFLAQATLSRTLMLSGRVGMVHYYDRDVIGTSMQQVNASTMTDIDLQVRVRL